MKILLIDNSGSHNITGLIQKTVWSGDYQQAARKLELDITSSPLDYYLPRPQITTGSMIKLIDDSGNELYRGYIFVQGKVLDSMTLKLSVYDGLIYLLKSKGTYNFKMLTAEQITRRVAADFGITIGTLAQTGIPQSLIVQGTDIYTIIMKAYTAATKLNEKKYLPIMQQGQLNVIEKGAIMAEYVLGSDNNLTDAAYDESIETMINRVKIYDENNQFIGTVDNSDWIKTYGILQEVYNKEKDKDMNTVARGMLKGIDRNGSLQALGDSECITGRAVQIKEPFTGLIGRFFIDADTHTWQNGQHIMQLSIHFENLMDTKE